MAAPPTATTFAASNERVGTDVPPVEVVHARIGGLRLPAIPAAGAPFLRLAAGARSTLTWFARDGAAADTVSVTAVLHFDLAGAPPSDTPVPDLTGPPLPPVAADAAVQWASASAQVSGGSWIVTLNLVNAKWPAELRTDAATSKFAEQAVLVRTAATPTGPGATTIVVSLPKAVVAP